MLKLLSCTTTKKADAPSGTAVKTAQMLSELNKKYNAPEVTETEKMAGARGSQTEAGVRIHSVRLPGLIAHQEVIFWRSGSVLYAAT